MTISTPSSPLSFAGNGSTTAFAITWAYILKSHVVATLRDSAGVETVQILTTNYTLTDPDDTGTLTMVVAPASGETLVITSEPPNTQETDFPLGGTFPAAAVEDGLDVAVQVSQKIESKFDRSLRVPKTDSRSGSQLEIPNETDRASKFLSFDSNGDPVASVSLTIPLLVESGGTGVATLTDGGILLGSGTSPITALGVMADGEMVVGDGTTDPVLESGATLRTSIGLGNVDNTADSAKPVSTAQQTALDLKANLISPTLVTPALGTPSSGVLTNCTALPLSETVATITNDNADAGDIGEHISASLVIGSAVSLTTNVAANVTSISLTAGDWDVSGVVGYTGAATTSITRLLASITLTSGGVGGLGGLASYITAANVINTPSNGEALITTPVVRITIASTTTVFLTAFSTFTVSTLSAFGQMRARRVR